MHVSFAMFYLTILAVAAITAVTTSAVAYLRNRDVRAQYAYIRSWASRCEERPANVWATAPTSAWRRLYRPPPREDDYVWPTPEPWPPATQIQAPAAAPRQIREARELDEDRILPLDRYAALSPAVIESHAQQLLDTVVWPDLAEQIAGIESSRYGRHRADRR
jgi:hypothetical protein